MSTIYLRSAQVTCDEELRSLVGGTVYRAIVRFTLDDRLQHVTTAHDGETARVVGVHLYELHSPAPRREVCLHSVLTWVSPQRRRDGVAVALWSYSLRISGARRVKLYACSAAGAALARTLPKVFHSTKFEVELPLRPTA